VAERTDVFVIGGGPAGLGAAIAARQRGFSVMVADGARPPIDKACGEGLMPDTVAALGALGVRLERGEGHAFRGIRFVSGDAEVDASFPNGPGLGLRRLALHTKLIAHAEERGVKLLWKTPVAGVREDGVALADGRAIAARWIVGADGIRSRVRRWIGAEKETRRGVRYACRRHYKVAPWSDCTEVYWGENSQAYVTAVSGDEVCVAMIAEHPRISFEELERVFPRLAKRVEFAEGSGSDRGAITTMRRLDRVYRGNVALIGDASGSVDAITGDGLNLSFHQATALADALVSGDLRAYQRAHRRLARRPTWMGRLMLTLGTRPILRERIMRALVADPRIFARLMAMHVGETTPAHVAATGALLGWRIAVA
jgi:flavin-dependent dehydrogenase